MRSHVLVSVIGWEGPGPLAGAPSPSECAGQILLMQGSRRILRLLERSPLARVRGFSASPSKAWTRKGGRRVKVALRT